MWVKLATRERAGAYVLNQDFLVRCEGVIRDWGARLSQQSLSAHTKLHAPLCTDVREGSTLFKKSDPASRSA